MRKRSRVTARQISHELIEHDDKGEEEKKKEKKNRDTTKACSASLSISEVQKCRQVVSL